MDIHEIPQLISSVGFPIIACGALFWMINTTMKQLTEAITELTKSLDRANQLSEEEIND